MSSPLTEHPIQRKWPASKPNAIQLYSLATPNGVKVSIALEELGLPYEAHKVDFASQDQFSAEFLSLNPNNKIPAILDPHGPGDKPLTLFESGAILLYLADKTGRLLPQEPASRYHAIQWLMWQMGGVGPMFGQLGFFHKFAGKEIDDKRPLQRYVTESARLLAVLEQQLDGKDWLLGQGEAAYSIADIAILPWVRNLVEFYGTGELVDFARFANVQRVLAQFAARPAVQRGLGVPG